MQITDKNGKKFLRISKSEWENIGKQAGLWDDAKDLYRNTVDRFNTNPEELEIRELLEMFYENKKSPIFSSGNMNYPKGVMFILRSLSSMRDIVSEYAEEIKMSIVILRTVDQSKRLLTKEEKETLKQVRQAVLGFTHMCDAPSLLNAVKEFELYWKSVVDDNIDRGNQIHSLVKVLNIIKEKLVIVKEVIPLLNQRLRAIKQSQ